MTNGRDIIPVVNKVMDMDCWNLKVASKDWHPSNHCSFASQYGVDPFSSIEFTHPMDPSLKARHTVWPDHCVQGSKGAEFPGEFTAKDRLDAVVEKGFLVDREYYSAFQDVWSVHHTDLEKTLRDAQVTDVYLVGLALDYCVYHTAIDAAKAGFKTHVIIEGSKPIGTDLDAILQNFKSGGVDIVSIDSLTQ